MPEGSSYQELGGNKPSRWESLRHSASEGINSVSKGINRILRRNTQNNPPSTIERKISGPQTIRELKQISKIPSRSGYERLIDQSQIGKPENMPDPLANELVRLYPDFLTLINDPDSGIPPDQRNRFLQSLNDGDRDVILDLAGRLMKRYLGKESLDTVTGRLNRRQSNKPLDLKIVLANQLVRHMQKLIADEKRNRVKEESIIEGGSVGPSQPVKIDSRVISQINNPDGPK